MVSVAGALLNAYVFNVPGQAQGQPSHFLLWEQWELAYLDFAVDVLVSHTLSFYRMDLQFPKTGPPQSTYSCCLLLPLAPQPPQTMPR